MIKELIHDPILLARKSEVATKEDLQTAEFQTRIKTFTGFPAQIIQHEVDHCDGVLI